MSIAYARAMILLISICNFSNDNDATEIYLITVLMAMKLLIHNHNSMVDHDSNKTVYPWHRQCYSYN